MKGNKNMKKKSILILVDGMRPDAILVSENQYLSSLAQKSTYSYNAQTVMPSYTLPCHTSLFFSLSSARHGITTNSWMPPVRPVESICDVFHKYGKKTAMFYNWEELRDLNKPGSLDFSYFIRQNGDDQKLMLDERLMTERAIEYILQEVPDFLFLYLGYLDTAGHNYGWMSNEYMTALQNSIDCIEKVRSSVPANYNILVTADHGGHDRTHGLDLPEDMTIPLILNGPLFSEGHNITNVSIKDIAPTIAKIAEIPIPQEWEGHSLLYMK